jgi:hypothetical protein
MLDSLFPDSYKILNCTNFSTDFLHQISYVAYVLSSYPIISLLTIFYRNVKLYQSYTRSGQRSSLQRSKLLLEFCHRVFKTLIGAV